MKKNYLTKAERLQFTLSAELREISIGLLLGDLYSQKQNVNVRFKFSQGIVHKEYLLHLYELFKNYCPNSPKIYNGLQSSIYFRTYSLPIFNELHELFYPLGTKIVPVNIYELLTPLGLCYWLCDDGSFDKANRAVILNTQGFTLEEVELLINVLTDKFGLKCTLKKERAAFAIRISSKSLPVLQSLLASKMPSVMSHKIGL